MTQKENTGEQRFLNFDPIVLVRDLLKRWTLILMAVLVVGMGAYTYATVTYRPEYIIEVQKLFGMGAVQFETEIDLVIQLEPWVEGKFYDRLGLGEDSYTMMGVSLPYLTIPVRPGRNLAGIVEIATMKNRQMKYGENSALDFIEQFDRRVDNMVNQARGNG